MAKWHKKGIFLTPLFKMKCMGCRDPLARFEEVGYALSKFPIDDDKPHEYNSHVIDRTYVCNLCGFRRVYGIALTKKHFDQIVEWTDEHGGISIMGKSQIR